MLIDRLIAALLFAVAACSPAPEPRPVAAIDADTTDVSVIRAAARPITGSANDYDPLMAITRDASFVLLGEATHGTEEFYRERARITRRLAEEQGFTAMAIEGDWPGAERVNRYVRGLGTDRTAVQALSGFSRFPEWMWPNAPIRDLVEWMRGYNAGKPATAQIGFYGMDLYSLTESADAVIRALETMDPAAARRTRERYRCFEPFRERPEAYGAAAAERPARSCQDEAAAVWAELERGFGGAPVSDPAQAEARFALLQNARVVRNAEEYYRISFAGGISPWNVRDKHMAEMLDALTAHLSAHGRAAKVVGWAHNTHMGDARVTKPGEQGEWNVGQLMRQRVDGRAVLVGFTTYTGTVYAAREWGGRGERRPLRPALPESYSALLHQAGIGNALLVFRGSPALQAALAGPRLERAVGVLYLPETERASHYFQASLSRQFDAVIHVDTSRAITLLR
ncbi:MAG: Protein-L-isoaspartate O-methyltransferase [uncultured Gemmatimonadetes bacterium]|uniref:Protein-L-isoaspartate O-methyltransferase n=1 Tax=uncultured Gemmatimonadota bacterium TaxID=203437 RepID=A0A6J4MHB7_9BACT|nr:MAG: Protein-L-isoaspartate O-methyltransferase [uncultured Gemmatimonadota bacterium]